MPPLLTQFAARMEPIKLGLKENLKQFSLLVMVNGFVGGVVGAERSILAPIAMHDFGIAAKSGILSFIIVFGVAKAISNYYNGRFSDRFGRRNMLIAGWVAAIPVPFILMFATNWNWIVAANILLGINQGLAWSSTVVMKIDLVGEKQRGFAMGINEFAGYIAVAVVAFLTGWVASVYGLRPYPFIIVAVLVFLGLVFSIFFIRETKHHVALETASSKTPMLKNIFFDTSWRNRNLGSVTQAGLVNNLNDGMMWGLLPVLLASHGFSITQIGVVAAVYPAVWGIGQLFTGKMADRFCKKTMLYTGMALQAIAIIPMAWLHSFYLFIVLAVLLGWGTAMVYPTFLATVAENTHPTDRAKSIGVFRFWRDLGYAIGAAITGIIADLFSIPAAIVIVGLLTLFSAVVIRYRMNCVNQLPVLKRTRNKGAGLRPVSMQAVAFLRHGFFSLSALSKL